MHACLRLFLFSVLLLAAPLQAAPDAPDQASFNSAVPEWRYTLRPGDTLIGVAQRYLERPADWPRVMQHNHILNPFLLVPGSTLRIPYAWLRHVPAPAVVVAVSGQARVSLPDASERALLAGERLPAGTALSTAANSSATLRFADGSVMVLQPRARLVLDTVSVYEGGGMVDTRVRLQQGRVEIGANPRRTSGSRLQVITPSAVAAVRGTRFRVSAEAEVTREETLEGAVGLEAAGQQVRVDENQGSLAETGKPPLPPVPLLPAPDVSALPVRIETLPLRFPLPPLSGAVGWLGQVAADATFEQILLENTSSTQHLSFADLPDGRYVLRLRAADALGLQGRDAEHAFEVDARPFAPLLTAPGARVRSAQPELQWAAVVGSNAYQVQVARDVAFSDRVLNQRTVETHLVPAQALASGQYYWRVANIEAGEQGPFSQPQGFTYDPLPGPPDINQAAPVFTKDALTLILPPPPAGLNYELVLARDAERKQVVWQGVSSDGRIQAAPVDPKSNHYLAARLVEADGSAGPYVTRVVEALPARTQWGWLLLLLPLLAL
ncbi:MAG: FecR domain-containing protein [Thiobacillus sp.]